MLKIEGMYDDVVEEDIGSVSVLKARNSKGICGHCFGILLLHLFRIEFLGMM